MMSVIGKTNIMVKVIRTLPMDKAMHNTQFPKIMSLMEIHPSLLKRPTELSQMLASKITISQRF